jgi:FixJ family two-component response regulator
MINRSVLVSVVDDDVSVRESLPDLLRELGYAARTFSSAEEFLASDGMFDTKCLILDIAMPGIGGPDLKRELNHRKLNCPVIFITAQKSEDLRARLVKDGAVDCLFKPFSDEALQGALDLALKDK